MTHSSAATRTQPLARRDVRDAYIEAGLSRRQFARQIGVPEQTIRRLENGGGIGPANAKRIADHFGVRVADVLALAEARTVAP